MGPEFDPFANHQLVHLAIRPAPGALIIIHVRLSDPLAVADVRHWYDGCPVEVRAVPGKGRGLFCTKDLKKGDVLLLSEPYGWAVYEQNKKKTCRYCLRDDARDLKLSCKKCNDVWYCGMQCYQRDLKVHQADECSVLRNWELDPKVYTPDTVSEMKMLLRILSCKALEEDPTFKPDPGQILYSDYCRLVARKEDFDDSVTSALNYWICDYVSRLRKWLGRSEEPEEMMDILVRNRRNSFYVASVCNKTPAGCAVYVTPSFFNHSCTSNVSYQSCPDAGRPRTFEYLADRDLPADTELCISYLDDSSIVLPYTKRRSLLQESFLFTCGCTRCVAEEEQDKAHPREVAIAPPIEVLLPQSRPAAE